MDIQEQKGGWFLVIVGFILAVLKTIGLIREKENENVEERKIQEEIIKRYEKEEGLVGSVPRESEEESGTKESGKGKT
jgi:hypothetical protein